MTRRVTNTLCADFIVDLISSDIVQGMFSHTSGHQGHFVRGSLSGTLLSGTLCQELFVRDSIRDSLSGTLSGTHCQGLFARDSLSGTL